MGNLFDNLPDDLTSEFFETIQANQNVKIERIVSKGHTSPESGWYDQDQNEWVLVVQGEATIEYPDRPRVVLRAGDYLNLPAHTLHRVGYTSITPLTIWLAIFY